MPIDDDDDDVQLPDLQVIQRYSLAVRGASAPRVDVIAALEADLDWLTGGRRRTTTPARTPVAASAESGRRPSARTSPAPSVARPAAKRLPAKPTPAPVKKAAAKKKSGARRA